MGGVKKAFKSITKGITRAISAIAGAVMDVFGAIGDLFSGLFGFFDTPSMPGAQQSPDSSNAYSVGLKTNQPAIGSPIPVVYGQVRFTPPLASQTYRLYEGRNETVHVLLCLTQGECDIDEVYFGQTPFSDFAPGTMEYKLYLPGAHQGLFGKIQQDFDLYEDVITSAEASGIDLPELAADWTPQYVINRPFTTATYIKLDISFPRGLWSQGSSSELKLYTVQWIMEYQKIDDDGVEIGAPIEQTFSFTDKRSVNLRQTFFTAVPSGRYKARFRRFADASSKATIGDEITVLSLGAVLSHPGGTPAYGNTSILAIKLRANETLSQLGAKAIAVKLTRLLPVVNPSGFGFVNQRTSNPADMVPDILSNDNYGGGLNFNNWDRDALLLSRDKWASMNGFNGVFDTKTTVFAALETLLKPVRGVAVAVSEMISVEHDEPKDVNFVFNESNILKDSLSLTYTIATTEDFDSIEVEWRDIETWSPNYAVYPFTGLNPKKLNLLGCTDKLTAESYARLAWQRTLYGRSLVSFRTEMEGILLMPTDHIIIAHHLPEWGLSGVIESINGSTLILESGIKDDPDHCMIKTFDGVISAVTPCFKSGWNMLTLTGDPGVALSAGDLVIMGNATETYADYSVKSVSVDRDGITEVEAVGYDERIWQNTYIVEGT